MMRLLHQHEIDRAKWDQCVQSADNALVYATSWYLDIVSPGWMAVVHGDYDHVFPLPWGQRFGLKFVHQPLFAQQLGVFGPSEGPELVEYIRCSGRSWQYYTLNVNRQSLGKLERKLEKRINHLLPLGDLNTIQNAYNQNTRRNIKKSQDSDIAWGNQLSCAEFVTFKRKCSMVQLNEAAWGRMTQLLEVLVERNYGQFWVARYENRLIAAVFMVNWGKRLTYLFSASNSEGKKRRASFLLVNEIIKEHAGKGKTLDFEGSMDDDISRFFKGFGGREEWYGRYSVKLPWLRGFK